MASVAGTEAKELSLVDKVEFRFALADTEAKLQSLLSTYLAPLLLKLNSEHVSVRNKVISICSHINARVKPQNILLPLATLIKQFKDNPTSSLVRHFDLLYVEQGITRLPVSDRGALFPTLVSGLAATNATLAQQAVIFHILLQCLAQYKLPEKGSPGDSGLKETLAASPDDVAYLSRWFTKLMLLRSPTSVDQSQSSNPGLEAEEVDFLTLKRKAEAWDPTRIGGLSLVDTKLKVLGLLGSGLFSEAERLYPVLLASSDTNSRISELAEDLLKRALGNADLEDIDVLERLFRTYFGTGGSGSESGSGSSQVSVRLRTRILGVLSRARSSSKFPQKIIQLVDQDLLQGFVVAGSHSKFDLELAKLRSAIVTFLTVTTRRALVEDLNAFSRPVIQSLRLFVEQDFHNAQSQDVRQVRGDSFEVIGLLASNDRSIVVEPQLELLTWMFRALSEEQDKQLLVSIDSALSSLLRCFQQSMSQDIERALTPLLLRQVKGNARNMRNVRFASLRFANRCLDFQNVEARWLDIFVLGNAADASHETVEEAKLGLDPYRHNLSKGENSDSDAFEFPRFELLVESFFWSDHNNERMDNSTVVALIFCRQALYWNALKAQSRPVRLTTDWERHLEVVVMEDLDSRNAVKEEMSTLSGRQTFFRAIVSLFNIALKALLNEEVSLVYRRQAGGLLLELCMVLPETTLQHLAPKHASLVKAVLGNDSDCRSTAAHVFGLLSARLSSEHSVLQGSISDLVAKAQSWREAAGSQVNQASGALAAIAGYVSRRLFIATSDEQATNWLASLVPLIVQILQDCKDVTLLEAAFEALGQLCMFATVTPTQLSSHMALPTMLEKVSTSAMAGNEKAIATLGQVSLTFDTADEDLLQTILEHTYKLHDLKQAESQFAIGEALASIACGWSSTALQIKFDLNCTRPSRPNRETITSDILDRILTDTTKTKPSLKKASVLWLLCFVQFCGDTIAVQNCLQKLQLAFKRCLSDRDELIQESASRGLGLVYEKGSKELKADLVRDMIGSLSSDRADSTMSGTVTGDTQLFEPGSLPTGEGQSVSTYKDIMSLASEVGDSSLVYRFMNLASSDALWSSRAAFGRFGLGNVLADSGLDTYLSENPKLYAKLFRYRFDPTPKVRAAMNGIWNSLVKDSTATVEKYFSAIVEDLVANMLAKEWRVRQACCNALADLVQGRELKQVHPYLEKLWTLCSKVLDDIKASVRTSAADLSRVLTGVVLRTLKADSVSSSGATKMLESVIPFLFSPSGLESSADEVKGAALNTLLEVVKTAKHSTLRHFVPDLVENLISLLTSLESSLVNYLYLNASKYNLEESDIDSRRLASVRSSPLMEAIERCLDALDDATMAKLIPKLQSAMRAAVGTPSKVGCTLVLVSLSTRQNFIFRRHADTLLDTMPKYLKDRNETVSQSYAAAMGYVARGASDDAISKVATIARRLYFAADDEKARLTSGEVVRAIAKYSTDRFAALASDFLPLVFYARHDEDEPVRKLFREIWNDNTGGPRTATLYFSEILALVNEHLASARWAIKHAAALAVAELAQSISLSQGKISQSNAMLMWPPLKQALAEKTWGGKEKVLDGFAQFAAGTQEASLGIDGDITKILAREAKRRNFAYQSHAFACFANVVGRRRDLDLHEAVCGAVEAAIAEHSLDAEKMEVDGKDADELAVADGRLRSCAIDALLKSCKLDSVNADNAVRQLDRSLDLANRLVVPNRIGAQAQSSVFLAVKALNDDLATRPKLLQMLSGGQSGDAIENRLRMLLFRLNDVQPETVRLARSDAALAMAKLVLLSGRNREMLLQDLHSAARDEKSAVVKQSLQAALDVLAK